MRRCVRLVALGMWVLGTSGSVAYATPITVQFSGTIASVNDAYNYFTPPIGLGSRFSGSYTIDAAASALPGFYPFFGTGTGTGYKGVAIDLTLGNLDVNSVVFAVVMNDTASGDVVQIGGDDLISLYPGDIRSATFAVVFRDSTGMAIDSEALSVLPDPEAFETVTLVFSAGADAALQFYGPVDSIAIVPEPGTECLIALGLVMLGVWRARRSNHPARSAIA